MKTQIYAAPVVKGLNWSNVHRSTDADFKYNNSYGGVISQHFNEADNFLSALNN